MLNFKNKKLVSVLGDLAEIAESIADEVEDEGGETCDGFGAKDVESLRCACVILQALKDAGYGTTDKAIKVIKQLHHSGGTNHA